MQNEHLANQNIIPFPNRRVSVPEPIEPDWEYLNDELLRANAFVGADMDPVVGSSVPAYVLTRTTAYVLREFFDERDEDPQKRLDGLVAHLLWAFGWIIDSCDPDDFDPKVSADMHRAAVLCLSASGKLREQSC